MAKFISTLRCPETHKFNLLIYILQFWHNLLYFLFAQLYNHSPPMPFTWFVSYNPFSLTLFIFITI